LCANGSEIPDAPGAVLLRSSNSRLQVPLETETEDNPQCQQLHPEKKFGGSARGEKVLTVPVGACLCRDDLFFAGLKPWCHCILGG